MANTTCFLKRILFSIVLCLPTLPGSPTHQDSLSITPQTDVDFFPIELRGTPREASSQLLLRETKMPRAVTPRILEFLWQQFAGVVQSNSPGIVDNNVNNFVERVNKTKESVNNLHEPGRSTEKTFSLSPYEFLRPYPPVNRFRQPVKPAEIYPPAPVKIYPPAPQFDFLPQPIRPTEVRPQDSLEVLPPSLAVGSLRQPVGQTEIFPSSSAELAPPLPPFKNLPQSGELVSSQTTTRHQPTLSQHGQDTHTLKEQQTFYDVPQALYDLEDSPSTHALQKPQGPSVARDESTFYNEPNPVRQKPSERIYNPLLEYVVQSSKEDVGSLGHRPLRPGHQRPLQFHDLQPQHLTEESNSAGPDSTKVIQNPMLAYVITEQTKGNLEDLPLTPKYQVDLPSRMFKAQNTGEANYASEHYLDNVSEFNNEETFKYENEQFFSYHSALRKGASPKESDGNRLGGYDSPPQPQYLNYLNGNDHEKGYTGYSGHGSEYPHREVLPQYAPSAGSGYITQHLGVPVPGHDQQFYNQFSELQEFIDLGTRESIFLTDDLPRPGYPKEKEENQRYYYRLPSYSADPLGREAYLVVTPSEFTFRFTEAFEFSPKFLETVYIAAESVQERQRKEEEDHDLTKCNPCNRNYNPAVSRFNDWQYRQTKCSGLAVCPNDRLVNAGPNTCVQGQNDTTACNPCGRKYKSVILAKEGAGNSSAPVRYEDIRSNGLTFYDDFENVYEFSDDSDVSEKWDALCGIQLPEGIDASDMYRYYYTRDNYYSHA